jgi:predicted membrane protein
MSKMGTGAFWGLLLIIIGLSIIIKVVFNIDFPIFKILIAFFFIYLGLKILFGHSFRPFHSCKDEHTVIFGERVFLKPEHGREYSVIFGKAVFDWQHFRPDSTGGQQIDVKINTIFGSTEMFLPTDMRVRIDASSAFGEARMPNGNTATFGNTNYWADTTDSNSQLNVRADVVFGSFLAR